MSQKMQIRFAAICALSLSVAGICVAQGRTKAAQPEEGHTGQGYVPEDHRPPLFFREDFTTEEENPLTQASLTNKNLEMATYGPGRSMVEKSHHASPKDDPGYIWLGACTQTCAFALHDKANYVDLTGLAKIRWRTKQTGFHELRLIIKLADGTWLIGDHIEGATSDWHETEFSIADVRWRRLDLKQMNDGAWVDKPDLTKVDEVGFTDLRPGSGSGTGPANGSSRVDWIEVYGNPVKRINK